MTRDLSKMKKNILLLASIFLLSACSLAPPIKTGEKHLKQSKEIVAKKLYVLASKCWSRNFTLFQDQVIVENFVQLEGIVIKAHRYAPDIGNVPEHIKIIVSDSNGGSNVQILESENGGYNQTSEVKSWLAGSNSCIEE